jgi:toxin ParE1/3/4
LEFVKSQTFKQVKITEVVIRPRAATQIAEAQIWYNTKKQGLGEEFLNSLEDVFQIIISNPLLFQVKHKQIRCGLLKRFPYGVFYFIDDKRIVVLSVFHLSMNPAKWKK